MVSKTSSMFLLSLALVLLCLVTAAAQGLQVGFYSETCPDVELIVRQEMSRVISVAPSLAGPLIRMHFHDCFVRTKGPFWPVPTGRKDGSVSIAQETGQLPTSNSTISSLISSFASKGLSVKDLVVLSGGRTLGTSHCTAFSNRIYKCTGRADTDSNLDSNYIPKLRTKCAPNDNKTLVEKDPGSFRTFDTSYYTHVSKRRGLFESDAALLQNSQTRADVLRQAGTGAFVSEFFKDFGDSMINMGSIQVLTGTQGEIRKTCAFIN